MTDPDSRISAADVGIVGAGPAGLAAAIDLLLHRHLALQRDPLFALYDRGFEVAQSLVNAMEIFVSLAHLGPLCAEG